MFKKVSLLILVSIFFLLFSCQEEENKSKHREIEAKCLENCGGEESNQDQGSNNIVDLELEDQETKKDANSVLDSSF
tara:strand:- start:80 stop:310 length:231 start_codon:yes stop_codon:yes gene_type:complete